MIRCILARMHMVRMASVQRVSLSFLYNIWYEVAFSESEGNWSFSYSVHSIERVMEGYEDGDVCKQARLMAAEGGM